MRPRRGPARISRILWITGLEGGPRLDEKVSCTFAGDEDVIIPRPAGKRLMKEALRQMFQSALEQLSLERIMPQKVTCRNGILEVSGGEQINLAPFKKILGVAIGKAAFRMAAGIAEILKPHVISGAAVSSVPPEQPLPYFLCYTGGHPYPNPQSFHAADVVREMLDDLKPHHLVIYLLSGGGSAICEKPVAEEISLEDSREFFRVLVTCGAGIVEMNVLRKHFSAIKGGRLAQRAYPARQVTLYVSDVPPGQPSSVASGPTMPDESTVEDCCQIAKRLDLLERFPSSIWKMFHEKRIPETPKPGDEVFENSSWHCLLDNQAGLDSLAEQMRRREWVVEADLSVDDWPLERAAEALLDRLAALRQRNPGRTVALLSGGELSCPVTGDGVGGRNQAFVLECARKIAGRDIVVLSAGTDGIDGNSDAAGAVADGSTLERAEKRGLDPADFQRRSDSYRFFEPLGDLIVTGPTGNNIRDVRILVTR